MVAREIRRMLPFFGKLCLNSTRWQWTTPGAEIYYHVAEKRSCRDEHKSLLEPGGTTSLEELNCFLVVFMRTFETMTMSDTRRKLKKFKFTLARGVTEDREPDFFSEMN